MSLPHGPTSASPPPPWTPEQWQAITQRGSHLLVSAAAGSGKTTVLVERVLRRITSPVDPVDVDRLLVVTFTEAAATQMRQRIAAALESRLAQEPGNVHLQRQLMLLPRASISTLHAFCRRLLQQYFYRIDLDPRFEIIDEHDAALLQQETLEETLEKAYEAARPGDPFHALAEAFSSYDGDEALRQAVLSLYEFARSLPDPPGWLKSLPDAYRYSEDGAAARWREELQRNAHLKLAAAESYLRQALVLAESPGGAAAHAQTLQEDLRQMETWREACRLPWHQMRQALEGAQFSRLRAARGEDVDETIKATVARLREKAKDMLASVQQELFSRSEREQAADLEQARRHVEALVRLTLDFHRDYTAAKAARSLLDFHDLEHLSLQLLKQPGDAPGAASPGQPEVFPVDGPQGQALSPVARELRERYVEVLVDEYQDTNGVQEALLELICRPDNLFAVGDVKQSIYRFRQADPSLFLARYRKAEEGKDNQQRIDLSASFRSRRSIVDAVNYLFRQIMVPEVAEMSYTPAAELVYKAQFPPLPQGPSGEGEPPVEVHLLEAPSRGEAEEGSSEGEGDSGNASAAEADADAGASDLTGFEREAVVAACRIRQLVDGGYPIWDTREQRYRPARYRDVVILLRATRQKARLLVEILTRHGIPAYADLGEGYFAATEVSIMLALLSILDNPRQDIPLASVLRSPLVGLEPADLARIRLSRPKGDFYDAVVAAAQQRDDQLGQRLQAFLAQLEAWRTAARRGRLAELIWHIYQDTRLLDIVGAMPQGRQRQANLRALYQRARQFDNFSRQGLSRFLEFIQRLQDAQTDLGEASAVSEDQDAVRVMSVHRSKGLEFPIVFLLDLGRSFQPPSSKAHLVFHQDLGIGAVLIDPHRRVSYPTLPYLAVRSRRWREEMAEEMRVLYVALTRAQQRLILVGSVPDLAQACADWTDALRQPAWSLDPARLAQARSWLDWLGPALIRHRDAEPLRALAHAAGFPPAAPRDGDVYHHSSLWEVHLWDSRRTASLSLPRDHHSTEILWDRVARLEPLPRHGPVSWPGSGSSPSGEDGVEALKQRLRERFAWQYPWEALTRKAAKVTASELKRRWNTDDGGESQPLPELLPVSFQRRAADQLTAAQRGSAVHLVMQCLDLSRPLDAADIRAQVAFLKQRGIITPLQTTAVDPAALAAFFRSSLGQHLRRHADQVRREVPFTLALPAGEVYPDLDPALAEGEYVVTQGIIDVLVPAPGCSAVKDGLWLVDFKTDQVPAAAVTEAARRYLGQMRLYRRALETVYGQPPRGVFLVFLAARALVEVKEEGLAVEAY